jgi:hypothetical protein
VVEPMGSGTAGPTPWSMTQETTLLQSQLRLADWRGGVTSREGVPVKVQEAEAGQSADEAQVLGPGPGRERQLAPTQPKWVAGGGFHSSVSAASTHPGSRG